METNAVPSSLIAKNLALAIYAIGVLAVLVLSILFLIGANIVPFPEAMIAYSLREIGVIYLGVGAIPMALAAWAVCRAHNLKNKENGKRTCWLVFAPALVCALPFLYLVGIFVYMAILGISHIISTGGIVG